MQFFDLNRQYRLNDILTPFYTLSDLRQQDWYLSKIRVDHDCLHNTEQVEGQAVLCSSQQIQMEMGWLIHDTGHELQVLFKGIETPANQDSMILVKGARLVDQQNQELSAQALSLWIDGTLLPMLPDIRKEIKSRLSLWDYAEYDV